MASGKLSGKTALVTGANSGIGKACVDRFIKEGAKVIPGNTLYNDNADHLISFHKIDSIKICFKFSVHKFIIYFNRFYN